ncbi:MAG: sulfatase [Alphaproteobacteria bacterium]|nr:sulfatase [Alphaproteobacteria bacterium]
MIAPLALHAALALLACRCGDPPALPPGGDRPDVLLISIDTLRADHVGVYGYDRDTTPFLDALAEGGVRFAHARSPAPWTLPSHTTMLSGLLPHQHHVVEGRLRIGADTPLLQEAFAAAGYATGGFVSSLYVGRRFGFDRGFEVFEDFGVHGEKKNLKGVVDAEDVVDAALGFTAARPDTPVFLFLHLYDVHYPYDAPAPWNTRFDRAPEPGDTRYKNYFVHMRQPLEPAQLQHQIDQYDEELAYVDDQLSRLIGAFRSAGRDPWVVVTADHGEEFYERGSWGHAHTLFPEQLHVPLILAGPGAPEGRVVEDTVGLQDIAPTLGALVDAPMDGAGLPLWPALEGAPLPARAFPSETSRFNTNRIGLWADGLRLDWDLAKGGRALYADPSEAEDLAADRPEDVERLSGQLTAILGAPWEADPGTVTTEGAILMDGAQVRGPLTLGETARFAVIPVDADVFHGALGPYRAAGGERPPPDGPLRYLGAGSAGDAGALSDDERARLEALGYLQGDAP